MDRYDTMKILSGSSASQYLPPDYLQPLPTTLDAKNSPLALLAQTCSSIGKDPPSKPIIPPIDRKDRASKSPSVDSIRGKSVSPKHHHKDNSASPQEKPRSVGVTETKDITNFRPMSTSSPKPERLSKDIQKPKEERDRKPVSDNERDHKPHSIGSRSLVSSPASKSHSDSGNSPKQKPTDYSKDSRESRDSSRDVRYTPPPKRQRSESPQSRREYSPAAEQKHQHSLYPGISLGALGYPPLAYGPGSIPASAEALAAAGYPFSFPGQGSYSLAAAQANALAAHQAALKSAGSAAALSQYMHYSRLRNPGAASGLSVCKDPYCTNCVSSSLPPAHIPSQCTSPGCSQCSQEKHLQSLSALGLAGHNPYSGLSSSSVGLSALHSIYAQNLLQQQQQQQQQPGQPHVCNWMAGGDYCGKRFATSEELLQHLRTHTAGGESALSAYSSLGLNIPTDLAAGGLPGYLGASAGNISPETLRRMYPTSLSPMSSSGLSNRYHPYKSGLHNVPSAIPPPQALSSVAPYYSHYNIYGQRIGAAAVP